LFINLSLSLLVCDKKTGTNSLFHRLQMALARINRPSTLPVAEKEGKDSLDNLFAQKTEKDPFLSLSKTSDTSFQWVQLLHAFDQGKKDTITEKKEDQSIELSHEKCMSYQSRYFFRVWLELGLCSSYLASRS
jgi:hypothetical protein